MCNRHSGICSASVSYLALLWLVASATAQQSPAPSRQSAPRSIRTPLSPQTLSLLANELSGQVIYNNMVKLAGAPWLRRAREFTGTLYEAQQIYDLAREYGIATARLEKLPGSGAFSYPTEGEFWLWEPQKRLVARLEADPALIAAGSRTAEVTGELVYLPPTSPESLRKTIEAGPPARYKGSVALMWSHPSEEQAKVLAAAGVQGVVSFFARDRYFDPNQVVYASGPYGGRDSLAIGFTVSWRQWSELLEDLQHGKKLVVRGKARVESHPTKLDTVSCTLLGTEPDAKGVVFTAHLFDGWVKRGANDNMSGCVIELEILRALQRLIANGDLPRPRRSIHFIWGQEISATYAAIKERPGFADRLSVNLNMDMVGEGLRHNNAVFRIYESPRHLPSYIDGLARSILNHVSRTNDVIYAAGLPSGRPGQYFPMPLVERHGSLDAFRFAIHPAAGGSDQICFHNPAMGVPAVMFLIWPDQWYHADNDTPDKADPTQLKRSAFIGAACAWAAAHCTDDVVGPLADAVSEHGYLRVAERELPRAMARLEAADGPRLAAETAQALTLIAYGTARELGALGSIEEIFSGSAAARSALAAKVKQWEFYRTALRAQVVQYANLRAAQLNTQPPEERTPGKLQKKYERVKPAIAPAVRGRDFDWNGADKYNQCLRTHAEAVKVLGINRPQASLALDYVNGRRSIAEIAACVAGELDEPVSLRAVAGYLELLSSLGGVVFAETNR